MKQKQFFQKIIGVLLKDRNIPYQFFECFKKHIKKIETKLKKTNDKDKKEKYWNYITDLFSIFCPTFFENINNAPSKYDIWKHNFPQEWKIVASNSDKQIPRIILYEFLQWARHRIHHRCDESKFDEKLTVTINGIFPNVHSELFTSFLTLCFSSEIKHAIDTEPNFHVSNIIISWSGEKNNDEINKMYQQKAKTEETINIIYKFFWCYWKPLTIFKDDLSEQENSNWQKYSEKKRKKITNRVRKNKLQKMKNELESDEIKKICDKSEIKESNRIEFLELINLLINKIENK